MYNETNKWAEGFNGLINTLIGEIDQLRGGLNRRQLESLERGISHGFEKNYLSYDAKKALTQISDNVLIDKEELSKLLDKMPTYEGEFNEDYIIRINSKIENYRTWKQNFPNIIKSLKDEINRGTGISVRRQLELLEQGDYVSFQEELDGDLKKRVVVKPGVNFKYLDKVCDIFCPIGLADKYNTWKIRRIGSDLELIKYFKNIDGDLLRVSANTFGYINIGGSARQVFDESTMNEIGSIEKVLNYGVPDEQRIPLKFVAVSDKPQVKKEKKSHTIEGKTDKIPVKKNIPGLNPSDQRLLRKLRRH